MTALPARPAGPQPGKILFLTQDSKEWDVTGVKCEQILGKVKWPACF